MLKRIRNYRPTWNVSIVEKESANYYPVTAKIAIEDDKYRLAVLNDRAQGGSSLSDGTIELMVNIITHFFIPKYNKRLLFSYIAEFYMMTLLA